MNTDMLRSHGYDPRGPGADRRYGNIPDTATRDAVADALEEEGEGDDQLTGAHDHQVRMSRQQCLGVATQPEGRVHRHRRGSAQRRSEQLEAAFEQAQAFRLPNLASRGLPGGVPGERHSSCRPGPSSPRT